MPLLKSLEIKQFRCYEHLVVGQLGRVNLIVGKNNVGKSAFLEALRIFANQGSPTPILEILKLRSEDASSQLTSPEMEERTRIAFWHLVYGRKGSREFREPIAIGPVALPDQQVSLALAWYTAVSQEQPDGSIAYREVSPDSDQSEEVRPALVLRVGGTLRTRLWLDQDPQVLRRRWLYRNDMTDGSACAFVSSSGPEADLAVKWWSRIALTDLEADVISALRLVDPDLDRLTLVESGKEETTFVARMKNSSNPILLNSMGEGMQRMLGIVLALVNAKGGIALIDEIENGIHYSVQYDMWRLLLRLAHQLDVQVFATSHSWDCVKAFQEATEENKQEEGALIRLTRKGAKVVATVFDEHDLSVATRQQIEVR